MARSSDGSVEASQFRRQPTVYRVEEYVRVDIRESVWVSGSGTVLVTRHQDGTLTVATRSEPDARWGPPVTVHPEAS
jgi:hypothetical protein